MHMEGSTHKHTHIQYDLIISSSCQHLLGESLSSRYKLCSASMWTPRKEIIISSINCHYLIINLSNTISSVGIIQPSTLNSLMQTNTQTNTPSHPLSNTLSNTHTHTNTYHRHANSNLCSPPLDRLGCAKTKQQENKNSNNNHHSHW